MAKKKPIKKVKKPSLQSRENVLDLYAMCRSGERAFGVIRDNVLV